MTRGEDVKQIAGQKIYIRTMSIVGKAVNLYDHKLHTLTTYSFTHSPTNNKSTNEKVRNESEKVMIIV